MTELDTFIPGLSADLITEYGKNIQYKQLTPGTYDRTNSTATPTPKEATIKGVVEFYKQGQGYAGNTLIEVGDLKVTMAKQHFDAAGIEPTSGDKLGIDGQWHNVINVLPTYSGELIAIYEIQIRAG